MLLAGRLKELRTIRGLTQAQLAQQLGISPSAVGMYEQGRRDPDHETLAKISRYFHVSNDFLLSEGGASERRDLDEIIDDVREIILKQEGLMFNGVLVDPADSEKIVDAIRLGIHFVVGQKKPKEEQCDSD